MMPPGRLPREVFQACPAGRRPRGRPSTVWKYYISTVAWEHLGISQSELVGRKRKVWGSLLELLPQRPDQGWKWMDGWISWLLEVNQKHCRRTSIQTDSIVYLLAKRSSGFVYYAESAVVASFMIWMLTVACGHTCYLSINVHRLVVYSNICIFNKLFTDRWCMTGEGR